MINLFHDTLTGVRSALVDYEEVPGSLGTSALLMESEGHKIKFAIKSSGEQGYILVKRTGWIGFEYKCFIEGKQVLEVAPDTTTSTLGPLCLKKRLLGRT